MKGATLHQRLACGAAPRRCWPASARPGTRVCVIVPSKDNASGSSGKRAPLWTFSDSGSGSRMLKHKQVLEEVFSRDAAEERLYGDAGAAPAPAEAASGLLQEEQEQQQHGLNGASAGSHAQQEQEQVLVAALDVGEVANEVELDAAALRERIESAALASTSAPSAAHTPVAAGVAAAGSLGSEGGRHHYQHNHQHQHNQQQHLAPASTAPHTSSGAAGLNGASAHVNLHHSHHQRQQQQASTTGDHHPAHERSPVSAHSLPQPQQQNLPGSNGAGPHSAAPAATTASTTASTTADASSGTAAPAAAASAAAGSSPDKSIPGSIWILCFISAALTCASCVFNTALPIYMVSELKMSMRSMGMFEGLLEAFSYVVRMCSGVVSDRMTSRKAAITLGFAAGAMAKFGMASASTVGLLFAGKAVDRLANGIQAAPRDALIGDLSPAGARSACFGLAQSLRKWGSAVGALAAFFLMKASNNNYQLIFYSAATVSLVACLAFVVLVPAHTRVTAPKEAAEAHTETAPAAAEGVSGLREFVRGVVSMGSDFYRMLGVISLYALGHINESLLEARAMEVGFGKAEATLVVAAIAAVTFLTAYPLGRLDDRYGAGTTFAVGIGALIAGDLVLLLSGPHPMALFASCLFLGVHWAVIQGPLLSIVSGLAPAHMRGTAFGIFYTVMAITAVAANTMYGSIWHTYGANAAFATSAALMAAVLVALPYMLPASARRGGNGASAAPAGASAPASGPLPGMAMPSLGGSGDGGRGPGWVPSPLPAAA